jgi:hypothetical protein
MIPGRTSSVAFAARPANFDRLRGRAEVKGQTNRDSDKSFADQFPIGRPTDASVRHWLHRAESRRPPNPHVRIIQVIVSMVVAVELSAAEAVKIREETPGQQLYDVYQLWRNSESMNDRS